MGSLDLPTLMYHMNPAVDAASRACVCVCVRPAGMSGRQAGWRPGRRGAGERRGSARNDSATADAGTDTARRPALTT